MTWNVETILVLAFLGTILLGMVAGIFDLIGASIYDLQALMKEKKRRKTPGVNKVDRPLLSIIIPAHNEEAAIERTLESIRTSSYQNREIVVVDDASSDRTNRRVVAYKQAHPEMGIRLVTKRKNVGKAGAVNAGLKHVTGDLVMTLDADSVLTPSALHNMVQHFIREPRLAAVAPNMRSMKHYSLLGLLQQFEYLTNFRSKKFYTVSNSEYIIGGSGATYRHDIIKKLKGFDETMWTEDIAFSLSIAGLGNKRYKLRYASDVIVYTEPVTSLKGLFAQRYRWKLGGLQALYHNRQLFFNRHGGRLTGFLIWFRLPFAVWSEFMLLLEPFMLSYFIYLAIVFNYPLLFAITWGTVVFIVLLSVWSDEYLSRPEKLRFTFYTPMIFSLFYIITFVQVAAMVKCLFNLNKITGKERARTAWQSPKRLADSMPPATNTS